MKISIYSIATVLDDFVGTFKHNSYQYLYESDIQAELSALLRRNINKTIEIPLNKEKIRKRKTIDENGNNKLIPIIEKDSVTISAVSTEYLKKIDIAIIDDNVDPSIVKYGFIGSGGAAWEMPLVAGIELKYLQLGQHNKADIRLAIADYKKLKGINEDLKKNYDFKPIKNCISIMFIQEENDIATFEYHCKNRGVWANLDQGFKIYAQDHNNLDGIFLVYPNGALKKFQPFEMYLK